MKIKVLVGLGVAMCALASSVPAFAVSYFPTAKAGAGAPFTAKQKNTHVFTVNGSSVECSKAEFKGTTPPAGGSTTLSVLPVYEGCKFAGELTKVDNSTAMCEYEFSEGAGTLPKFKQTITIKVAGCKIVITVTLFGFSCTVTVGPQTGLTSINGEDLGTSHETGFLSKAEVTNVTYTAAGSGCGLAGISSGKAGKYTGEVETEAIFVM